jgi:endonuclease/exonuclease/phosphatase family metal-dependent hydrolase
MSTLRQELGSVHLRLMAANLTSGANQSYDTGEGTRIMQALSPDVIMIQEFNAGDKSDEAVRRYVDTAFGTHYFMFRETGQRGIPNGIISRYPIREAGEWDDPYVPDRDFAFARIDIPGDKDLWAVSIHLRTSGNRSSETSELVKQIRTRVPPSDYLAIGGDFNTSSHSDGCFTPLSQVVGVQGPYPADSRGNVNTNAARKNPYDYVLVDADLTAYQTATVVGSHTFPNGFVADTRAFSPIGDMAPARTGDSGASNMQHMGIVRDFMIPSDVITPRITLTAPNGGESLNAGGTEVITWTVTAPTTVDVEYTTDGAYWNPVGAAISQDSAAWTVPEVSTNSARIRVSSADLTLTDQSDAPFTIVWTPPNPGTGGRLVINEVLANEPQTDSGKEFVELVNTSNETVDLSGWSLADSVQTRHSFATGTTLAPGRGLVIFGNQSGMSPALPNAYRASTGSLNLSNSGDTVILRRPSGEIEDSLTYSSALSGTDGVSMTRSIELDRTAQFVLHTRVAATFSSPGVRSNGSAF